MSGREHRKRPRSGEQSLSNQERIARLQARAAQGSSKKSRPAPGSAQAAPVRTGDLPVRSAPTSAPATRKPSPPRRITPEQVQAPRDTAREEAAALGQRRSEAQKVLLRKISDQLTPELAESSKRTELVAGQELLVGRLVEVSVPNRKGVYFYVL